MNAVELTARLPLKVLRTRNGAYGPSSNLDPNYNHDNIKLIFNKILFSPLVSFSKGYHADVLLAHSIKVTFMKPSEI